MKKGIFIIFATLALTFAGCNSNTSQKAKDNNGKDCEVTTFELLRIKKTFNIDTISAESPRLDIDISLMVPQNTDSDIAKNISKGIAYTAFGYEGIAAEEAADSIVNNLVSDYYELRNNYINEKGANPDAPWFNNYYMLNSNVKEGVEGVICYEVFYEIYSGGVHPSSAISYVNFEERTGKEITLQDIFKENSDNALIEKLTTELCKKHNVNTIAELQDLGYLTMNEMFITNNFLLEKDSIIFLYNQYEIAPYALGRSRIAISYDEIKDILNDFQF